MKNMKSGIYDVVLCKNTLHHMQGIAQKEMCLDELKRLCRKRIILMDVEYPMAESARLKGLRKAFVKARHYYYLNILGEAGPESTDTHFLSVQDFRQLVNRKFPSAQYAVSLKEIPTLKANYMCAAIDVRTG